MIGTTFIEYIAAALIGAIVCFICICLGVWVDRHHGRKP